MTVSFDLPVEIENSLRQEFADLNQAAKEAALVELYRQHQLTHHELATALGLSRFALDALLQKHGVFYEVSAADVAREANSIRLVP